MLKHINQKPEHSLKNILKTTIAAQLHAGAAVTAAVGLGFLLVVTSKNSDAVNLWACLIFGVTGILVFGSSALYHFCSDGYVITPELEKWLNDFDHFSIYLFIAGTYTPFLINAVKPPWSQYLLVLIWIIAIVGILYSYFKPRLPKWAQHRFIYTGIFLAMGWALVIRWSEIYSTLSSLQFGLALAGGLSYSIGAVIYATEWPDLWPRVFGAHEIWHVMVMGGFAFHYFLILGFYL
jgi:hemolysin III